MIEFIQLSAGILLQMLFCALMTVSSILVAKHFLTRATIVEQICAAGVICFWLASLVFNVLVNLRLFYSAPALISAAAIFIAACRQTSCQTDLKAFWHRLFKLFTRTLQVCNKSLAGKAAAFSFAAFTCLLLTRSLLLPMICWDSLTYHTVKANLWVQNGCHYSLESPGLWESYKTFPGGGEAFTALSMVFTRNDFFGSMPDFLLWLLMGAMAFAIAKELTFKSGTALAVSAAIIATPVLTRMVGSGYVDTGVATFLLGGILFFMKLTNTKRTEYLLLSAMSYGIAGSIKVNGLATAIIMIVFLVSWAINRRISSRGQIVIALTLFAAPVIPWFWFNYQASGFIFGTTPVKIGALVLGQMPLPLEYFFSEPSIQAYSIWPELEAASQALSSLGLYAIIPLLAIAGALVHFKQFTIAHWIAALQGFIILALHFSPSFSVIRHIWAAANGRFIISAIVLLTVTGLANIGKSSMKNRLIISICQLSMLTSCLDYILKFVIIDSNSAEIILMVATTGLSAIAGLILGQACSATARSVSYPFLMLLCFYLPAFGMLKKEVRLQAYERYTISHDHPRYWTDALKHVNDKQNVSIAFTYGMDKLYHSAFIAPFFGERLQNRISYVSPLADGRTPVYHPDYIDKEPYNYEIWLKRMREAKITHLLCFAPKCQELSWARDHRESFVMLEGNRVWGFFELK